MSPWRRALLSCLSAALVAATALLLVGAAAPTSSYAQAACRLPARLRIGDAVEVIDRQPNRLRSGPGLGFADLGIRMAPGDVWYVQAGPICNDGIHWYQVAAYDAAGWTAEGQPGRGYYLARTNRLPGEGGGSGTTPVCASNRLSVGMRAVVGDRERQHVRQAPSRSAAHVAWLYPGVPVTLLDGPRCANGWVWWYVRDDSGRIQGWAAEGDGPAIPWLVPLGSGGSGAALATPMPTLGARRSTFVGTATVSSGLTPTNHVVLFSPDLEAVTVSFSDFEVRAPAGASGARRTEILALPVRSGPRGYVATATVLGAVDCTGGGRATLTLQVGAVAQTTTCQGANTQEVTVRTSLPADAALRVVVAAQVWGAGAQAQPSVTVDVLDIGLAAP